jgi:ribonuclease BN (tRNA processing enzyme)
MTSLSAEDETEVSKKGESVMRTPALVFTAATLLVIGCLPAAAQVIKDKPTPSRAEWAPLGQAYGRDYSTSDVTKVVVLGSGTPTGDTRHSGISIAVVVNGQPYIFDCGPGFWRNSQASTPAYGGKIAALETKNLNRLFLTHLHFDHIEGMPEFMLAPWAFDRKGPIQVYGPPGTEDMVHHLTEAFTKDIDLQMFGLEEANATGYVLNAKDVLPGQIYKDNNVQITAYQNHHGSWDYTYAYRVVTSKPDGTVDRTIVFSGDTSVFDGMAEIYAGADILFHEAYSFDPKTNPSDAKAPVSATYMNAFHTSTEQLAGVLKKVNPKVTVLYHYVVFTPANETDQERGVKEIKKFGYNGIVIQSQDADIF